MKKTLLLVGFLMILSPATALAKKKPCHCWIGIEEGQELVEYGVIATYPAWSSKKKKKCSAACASKCAGDINNSALLCAGAGTTLSADSPIGCFSVVGKKDSPSNTWDYDGRPANFPGCSLCCDCPGGTWFDQNRRSCVVGACEAPGIPNGDKGGGYFAWDGHLYQDLPGATNCKIVTGPCPPPEECSWTPWLDRDNGGGNGDFETLSHFVAAGQACADPSKIECQTVGGQPWQSTGQVYSCTVEQGGICLNQDQPPGSSACRDYRVRFCCP